MTDATVLAALHAASFETPWSAETFRTLLAQPGVTVFAEVDGFILLRTAADEAEILTLAVQPSRRRAGLGARLVARAVGAASASGAARLFLEVADDNTAARGLYAQAGFAEVGRRPAYYARSDAPPRDALLLALNLPEPLP